MPEQEEGKLKPGERIDDLQRGGLRIIQQESGFRFGTDAVLLADFAKAKRGERGGVAPAHQRTRRGNDV